MDGSLERDVCLRAWVRGRLDFIRQEGGKEEVVWDTLVEHMAKFTGEKHLTCARFLKRMKNRGELK